MKNRLYLVCGVLLVAAVGGLLWWSPWEPRQPVYEGKPINWWIQFGFGATDIVRATPMGYGSAPRRALPSGPLWLRQLVSDPEAVPFLVAALKKDRWLGEAFYRDWAWPKLPVSIKHHLRPPADRSMIRCNAAILLGYMGPLAEPAVPAMILALRTNEDSGVSFFAAMALGNIGPDAKAALPALRQVSVNGKDEMARKAARHAEAMVAPEAVAERLIGALGETNGYGRLVAVQALTDLCVSNGPVIRALTDALDDPLPVVRWSVTNSLLKLSAEGGARAGVKMPSP